MKRQVKNVLEGLKGDPTFKAAEFGEVRGFIIEILGQLPAQATREEVRAQLDRALESSGRSVSPGSIEKLAEQIYLAHSEASRVAEAKLAEELAGFSPDPSLREPGLERLNDLRRWSVVEREGMAEKDTRNGALLPDGGFVTNPTRKRIQTLFDGKVFREPAPSGRVLNGVFPYVVDLQGRVIVGLREEFEGHFRVVTPAAGEATVERAEAPTGTWIRLPHPSLIGGKNPQVLAAGTIQFEDGKILSIDNASGHFRPDETSLDKARDIFRRTLPRQAFVYGAPLAMPFDPTRK